MSFSFRYQGELHTDTSDEYLEALGLDSDTIESIQNQASYITQKEAAEAQAWAIEQLALADIAIHYHQDGDSRATATEDEWRAYRVALRDYVSSDENGDLTVNGGAPNTPT